MAGGVDELGVRTDEGEGVCLRQAFQPIGEQSVPLDARQFLLEPLGGSDAGAENAILRLIQDDVDFPYRS